jgi:hypothetical protein
VVFLFRDKSVINILFLIILSIGVHFHFLISEPLLITNNNDGYISLILQQYFSKLDTSFLFIIYILSLLIQAVRFNLLLNELKMFQQSAYTVGMTYILLSGFATAWCSISSVLFANFLLIWLFTKMLNMYNHPNPKSLIFNIGLIVGISIIGYHPIALMLLVILFALGIMRSFKIQEWVILLLGLIIPYYFLGAYLFFNNQLNSFTNYLPHFQLVIPSVQFNTSFSISIIVLGIAFLAGLFYWQQYNSRLVIQIRKNWATVLVMCIVLFSAPFFFKQGGIQSVFLCLVPLAAMVSNAFSFPKRFILPNLLFLMMIIVVMYNNWQLIKN